MIPEATYHKNQIICTTILPTIFPILFDLDVVLLLMLLVCMYVPYTVCVTALHNIIIYMSLGRFQPHTCRLSVKSEQKILSQLRLTSPLTRDQGRLEKVSDETHGVPIQASGKACKDP